MRVLGIVLTAVSLLAVQAPWVACGCSEDPAFAPILTGLFAHSSDDHEHDEDHGHDDHDHGCCAHQRHCCDTSAHIAHGHHHGHGAKCASRATKNTRAKPVARATHCHGHFKHAHDENGDPLPPEPSDHVGFRVPAGTMPPPVALDDVGASGLVYTLILDAGCLAERGAPVLARTCGPPGPPPTPGVATERLLL